MAFTSGQQAQPGRRLTVKGRLTIKSNHAEIQSYSSQPSALLEIDAGADVQPTNLVVAEGTDGALRNFGELCSAHVAIVDSLPRGTVCRRSQAAKAGSLRLTVSLVSTHSLSSACRGCPVSQRNRSIATKAVRLLSSTRAGYRTAGRRAILPFQKATILRRDTLSWRVTAHNSRALLQSSGAPDF